MKLSTILSFTALGATAVSAFPLSSFYARGEVEERAIYAPAPVRRSVEPTPTESATEASATEASATEDSVTETASATETSSASEATATESATADSTDTYLYSTITESGASTPPASTRTLEPTTETATTSTETSSASESTETASAESTDISRNNNNDNNNDNNRNNRNNNNNNNNQIIIIKEVIRIREVIVIDRPILVAVQINVKVRQTIIVNQIRNVFISRFDNWDQNVVDQLGLVISQQFDILTRSRNSGFDHLSNDQYNQFVSKFISQFDVFQSFQLADVQQLVIVLQSFGINELSSFFGRSDALFNQDTFNRFNVNNDFKVFVQQLTVIVESISTSSFNSDNLFGFESSQSLIVAGSVEA